jgi:hypothetical protein
MTIAYRIDKESGATIVLWSGVVTEDEFLSHVRRLSSNPDWPPPRRLHLADLQTALLDASMDKATLEAAAALYGQHHTKLKDMKAAVVAGEPFWKAVDFELLISQYGASVIVFNSLSTACTWLGIHADQVDKTLRQLQAAPPGATGSASAEG